LKSLGASAIATTHLAVNLSENLAVYKGALGRFTWETNNYQFQNVTTETLSLVAELSQYAS